MANNSDSSNAAWFLAGLALGAAGAILLAPRSGTETREAISDAALRGRDFANRKGREVAEFGREVMGQGRHLADEAKDVVDKGKKILADLSAKEDDDSAVAT